MAMVSNDAARQFKTAEQAYKQLFKLEEMIALTTIVLQTALHDARGATQEAFVYKRLCNLCKDRITRLNKERREVLSFLTNRV